MTRAGFVFRFLKPCVVAAFMTFLAACGGGGGGGGEPVRTVTTVTVSSPTSTPKQGDTVQLTAVARDQFGDVVQGTTATWSSSAPSVATVSATGLLQALAGGSVTVTATISNVSGSLTLTITPRVTTTVTVGSPTASPSVGETVQLTVVARDQFGDVLSGRTATWSTSDAKVATISATGLLQAVAPGTVVATATIDGLPGSLTLTVVSGAAASVTVSSPTATPQAGEAVQLTAVVRDRDGNLVPGATVGWSTSDARIATVSASGLLQALTPGNVVATATVGSVAGSVSLLVLGPPAAYYINDVEYAFDYQLDAEGRVDSYRIYQRPGLSYLVPSGRDFNEIECTGSLHGTYICTSLTTLMKGEAGRLTYTDDFTAAPLPHTTTTYRYGDNGLYYVASVFTDPASFHRTWKTTTTLSYNAEGRPSEIVVSDVAEVFFAYRKGPITTDSQGRLLRAELLPYCPSDLFCSKTVSSYVTEWTYGAAGFMQHAVFTEKDQRGVTYQETTTRYEVDDAGWLTARLSRSEGAAQTTEATDTWTVVRAGGKIVEEQFRQAEPKAFYRGPGRVCYQPGRLPSEPLFTPRALTGLNGADYFGVISSHDR